MGLIENHPMSLHSKMKICFWVSQILLWSSSCCWTGPRVAAVELDQELGLSESSHSVPACRVRSDESPLCGIQLWKESISPCILLTESNLRMLWLPSNSHWWLLVLKTTGDPFIVLEFCFCFVFNTPSCIFSEFNFFCKPDLPTIQK